jgi:nucleotide-binding universal stress UspA family protein
VSTTSRRVILVGLDGSPGSGRALEKAIELARTLGAEIVAVTVAQLMPYSAFPGGEPVVAVADDWQSRLRETFEEEWCRPLRDSGLPNEIEFREGSPASELIAAAREHQAEMIVIGTRGSGGFRELLLGGVCHQVSMHSPVPVLIVPPAAR